MNSKYHIEITCKALSEHFSERALKTIIHGNIRQDSIKNQIGHDWYHFDSNTFAEGFAYIEQQRKNAIDAIMQDDFMPARTAFGRLLHTWQDFYSHSNYVRLWLEANPSASPDEIIHDDKNILHNPDLRSGMNYGFMEYLALLPVLSSIITPHMPDDSHAKMNLDSPRSGILFVYAYNAAIKRTTTCYDELIDELSQRKVSSELLSGFRDQ
jgi:hypothetical protein